MRCWGGRGGFGLFMKEYLFIRVFICKRKSCQNTEDFRRVRTFVAVKLDSKQFNFVFVRYTVSLMFC